LVRAARQYYPRMTSFIRTQSVAAKSGVSPRSLLKEGKIEEAISSLSSLDRQEFSVEAQTVAEALGDFQAFSFLGFFVQTLLDYPDEQQSYAALRHAVNALLALSEKEKDGKWPLVMSSCAEMLLKYLDVRPSEPILLNHLAVCLYELNEVQVAKRLLHAALVLAPDTPFASENLKEVERRLASPLPSHFPAALKAKLPVLKKKAENIASKARPAKGLKVSLCMIVKDEEADIGGCLDSIKEWVDEIIVVDTGSSDSTASIAASKGAKIINFPWTGSFAEARNVSLEAATGDWILYLDADERLSEGEGEKFKALAERTWREGIYLQETNFTGTEDSGGAQLHVALRFFRNRPWYRFEGAVHEQKLHTFPTDLTERFEVSDVRIEHHGYLKHVRYSKDKIRRNIELLEKQVAERPNAFNLYNLGSEYSWLKDYAKARPLFERSLKELQKMGEWRDVSMFQFSPMLVVRLAESIRVTEPEAVEAFIAQGLEWFPRHTDLVFERALARYTAGDMRGAQRDLETCITLGDANVRWGPISGRGSFLALVFLADIQKNQGNIDQAISSLKRSLEEWPAYTPALYNYASLLLASGRDAEKVEEELNNLTFDWSASTRMWAANAFYELRHFEQAERWYRLSLELAPNHATSLIGLAETLLSTKRYKEAALTLSSISDQHPLEGPALRSRIFALILTNDFDEATDLSHKLAKVIADEGELYLAWLEKLGRDDIILPLTPSQANFGLQVMEALLRLEEWEKYDSLTPLVIAAAGEERQWRRLLSGLYERVDLNDLAMEQWLAICKIDPDADAFYGLARSAVIAGHLEDGQVFLTSALELDPVHLKAQALLSQLNAHLTL
jgi:glycosyltransferase involved in cell wall biosynthesis/Flp pilus assembly protein TadD